jgi:pyroglutamyl-peptidase
MIHIGMAGGRGFYSVERRGHRDGYMMGDVDGIVLGDERGRHEDGNGDGEKWVWEGCPEELETGVDLDDVWRRWRTSLPVSLFLFSHTVTQSS